MKELNIILYGLTYEIVRLYDNHVSVTQVIAWKPAMSQNDVGWCDGNVKQCQFFGWSFTSELLWRVTHLIW